MYWLHAPLGVQFQPNDETLVSGYLLPKYRGEIFPDKFIAFSDDVYDKPPSEFCSDSTAFSGKHYFFTDLNRAKERAARTVGDYASWHMSSKRKIKNKNKEIIGYKKLLNFKLKGEGENTTDWFMHEYSLHLNEGESNNLGESKNLVLCVIQNKEEKGTGSCLVLGLDSGSGSERLEIAAMKSCSDAEIAEAERGTGGLDQTVPQSDAVIAEASPPVPQSDAEIAEASPPDPQSDAEIASPSVPQSDAEIAELSPPEIASPSVPQSDAKIAEARPPVAQSDAEIAEAETQSDAEIAEASLPVPQSDAEIAEAERGTGGLDQTVPQSDEEMAEAERGTGGLEEDTAGQLHRVLADERIPQFDKGAFKRLMQEFTDTLAGSTTTANENPCPAQDEETQQRKKMRHYSGLEELDDALFTDDSDDNHLFSKIFIN